MGNAYWKGKDKVCEAINACFFENPIEHTISEPKKKILKSLQYVNGGRMVDMNYKIKQCNYLKTDERLKFLDDPIEAYICEICTPLVDGITIHCLPFRLFV